MRILLQLLIVATFSACESYNSYHENKVNDTIANAAAAQPTLGSVRDTAVLSKPMPYSPAAKTIHTGTISPQQLLEFANKQIGVPYKYGSTDPANGFDCSGFITYVFNHFNIAVPRSSVDFTNVEREIPLAEAKPGDLILFTGTDSSVRVVGHMGIITSAANSNVEFIQSTSGKRYGVTITPVNNYYRGRFMKLLRIFPQNDLN